MYKSNLIYSLLILSLGSPQLGKCYQGVTAPERVGTAVLTEINMFSVEFKKLKEMIFYGYGWASYSIPVVQHI